MSPTLFLTDILLLFLVAISFPRIKKRLFVKAIVLGIVLVVSNLLIAKEPLIALIKWVKILEIIFLVVYISINKRFNKTALIALSYSIVLISIIGIWQFILQRTIGGPLYLLGERSFSSATPGIALAGVMGREYLRAYSTFPHPNAFAGFLGVGIILFLTLNSKLKVFGAKFSQVFILFSLAAFLLTFSLGAFIAGVFTFIYYIFHKKSKRIVTKSTKKIFIIIVCLSLLMTVPQELIKNKLFLSESTTLRIEQAGVAAKMFLNSPLFGVGLNNFIPSIGSNITTGTSLFLQPVHNICLLILTETGLLGLGVFVFVMYKILSKSKNNVYAFSIVFVLITGLFDHYWFTLQQNQFLLALLLGMSLQEKSV